MDSNLLRHFVAVAHASHYAHAAKALGVPRAAVVASVRKLEAELGFDLFDRTATTTVLTDEGVEYLSDARAELAADAARVEANRPAPGGKAKASKGKGRAPAVKGAPRVGKRRQSR